MKDQLNEELGRQSNRIVNLILHSNLDWIDIALEEDTMRQKVLGNSG